MTSRWRSQRSTTTATTADAASHRKVAELTIPPQFRCPISLELMKDPVTLSTGITYDRQSIETWLEAGNRTCPVTNRTCGEEEEMPTDQYTHQLIPNHALRRMIQDWCVANRAHGVDRIPTPRIPATPAEARDLLSDLLSAAVLSRDAAACRRAAARLRSRCKESDRNRRCFAAAGAAAALSAAFASGYVADEVLSALAGIFPLDEESRRNLLSSASLNSLVHTLTSGDLAGRLKAALVVKELVHHADQAQVGVIARTVGMVEALVKLIKEPISPQATKASLVAIFYLVSSNETNARRFVDTSLVHLLVDILVDTNKSTSEKALGVLEGLCSCERGREEACDNALTVPVVVKKMFRVSDMATEFAVSILWKLCKSHDERKRKEEEGGERVGRRSTVAVEALQVGAFQKLLLLLQVGCSEGTKDRANELLKLLNGSRERMECIESVDLKGLKRPF